MKSLINLRQRLSMAAAIAMGGLPSFIPGMSRNINWDAGKKATKAPFSSDRQNRRTASKVYNRRMPNGQVVMQTLPTWARRNDVEVDALLTGKLKTQIVE